MHLTPPSMLKEPDLRRQSVRSYSNTMSLAPVDDKGTHLYYEDSGPIASAEVYETLVLFHGIYFNGGMYPITHLDPILISE